jgi:hypothetical protein
MRFHSSINSPDDLHLPALCARIHARNGYIAFNQLDTARAVTMELLRTATRFQVEAIAYCVLPAHVSVLLAPTASAGDARGALRRWKQLAGRSHRVRTGCTLWKPRSAEWLIEDAATLWDVAGYLISEPVRLGLVRNVGEYRWLSAPPAVLNQLASGGHRPRMPVWWPAEDATSERRNGRSSPR